MLRQEVLTEQALRVLPVGRELAGLLHQGMNPGDAAGLGLILDAVTSLGIVFHDLPGTASAADVQLEESVVEAETNSSSTKSNGRKKGFPPSVYDFFTDSLSWPNIRLSGKN